MLYKNMDQTINKHILKEFYWRFDLNIFTDLAK